MTRDLLPLSGVGLAGFDCPSCRCFLSVSLPSSVPSTQPASALTAFWRKGQRKWKVFRRNTAFSPGIKARLRFLLLSVVTEESCWEFAWLGSKASLLSDAHTAPTHLRLFKSPKRPADLSWVWVRWTQKCQVWDLGSTKATWLAPGYSLLMSSVFLQDLLTWAELWDVQIILEGSVPLSDRPCLCFSAHSTSQNWDWGLSIYLENKRLRTSNCFCIQFAADSSCFKSCMLYNFRSLQEPFSYPACTVKRITLFYSYCSMKWHEETIHRGRGKDIHMCL